MTLISIRLLLSLILKLKFNAKFDYINRDTYEITPQDMSVKIEHTDGCGIILPKKSKKAFMVRLPYVKGLLVPFAFDEFAKEKGNTNDYRYLW
jgi:hypothetical protein